MKTIVIPALFVAAAVLVPSTAAAQEERGQLTAKAASERAVRVEATIHAPVSEVWRVWTTSAGAEEFFADRFQVERRDEDVSAWESIERTVHFDAYSHFA